MSETKPISLSA